MTTLDNKPIRFSGIRQTAAGLQAFHPGLAGARAVTVSVREKPENEDIVIPMQRQGDYWTSAASPLLRAGALYQIQADGKPVLEATEQKTIQDDAANDVTYNVVPDFDTPQKSGPVADVFQDSLVGAKKLNPFLIPGDPLGQKAYRDHFNQFGGDEHGFEVLYNRLDPKNALRAIIMRPVIGGDSISANKYWTQDLFGLNNTFSSKDAMRAFLIESMRRDTKVFFDGAFVNEGLNGVHMLSNLRHRERSPYWNQFNFPETSSHDLYPKLIQEGKLSFGVLPTLAGNDKTDFQIDYNRFAFRVLNDPAQKGYHPAKATYIELYDPLRKPGETLSKTWFDKSAQHFRFPVSPAELAKKRAQIHLDSAGLSAEDAAHAERKAFCDWSNFRLSAPQDDNSSIKWDGQIDVAKMNMREPSVKAMVQDAMAYWTRFVRNAYQETVADALSKTAGLPGVDVEDWAARIAALDYNPKQGAPRADYQVLPPQRMRSERLHPADIQTALENAHKQDAHITGRMLTDGLLGEFPLMALPVPIEFKSTLYLPEFRQEALQARGPLRQTLSIVAAPLVWAFDKFGMERAHDSLTGFLNADTVEARLSRRFEQELLPLLSADAREKLRHPQMRSLVYELMGEDLFLKMLTNQHHTTPKAIEDGLYKTVPTAIHTADPLTAARMLSPFLKKRLKQVDYHVLAQDVEKKLATLDPQTVCLAEAILNRREFGLNWRIDAAKDVGDMDRVRNPHEETGEDKGQLFRQEMEFVHGFFKDASQSVKGVFPKATIIAELTDCNRYGDAMPMYRKFLDDGTFTSMPNFDRMFNTPARLLHSCPTPWEDGPPNKTISPFYFLGADNQYSGKDAEGRETYGETYAFNTLFPWHTARQFQNLNASHDASSLSHRMLYTPLIYGKDMDKWAPLSKNLADVADELQAACFDATRDALRRAGVQDMPGVLNQLKSLADSPAIQAKLPTPVQDFWTQDKKQAYFVKTLNLGPDADMGRYMIPNPSELKLSAIDALFEAVTPDKLGVGREAHALLKTALRDRMAEASETRAMRGVLNNALESQGLARFLQDAQAPAEGVHRGFYAALDEKAREYGRHFGYLPLDRLVHEIVEAMPASALPAGASASTFRKTFKNALYDEAIAPVLIKLQRAAALNVAVPGNPTLNLPDLLGQTGGEYMKNMFLQNRPLIRHDWLESKPNIRAHVAQLGEILRLRTDYESLNNGFSYIPTVPLPQNGGAATPEDPGVVPIVRDNGEQQTLMLVNTGKPLRENWDHITQPNNTRLYYEHKAMQPVARNYKVDLAAIDIAPGATYRDVKSGERFVVNDARQLVRADRPDQGLDIEIYRLLTRESHAA
ncbi:MAG: hypothetical protein IPK79_09745 [Vampirovibrionales bacterium]|nr:hypothetical protein [Vampirovibrionales bacterium]